MNRRRALRLLGAVALMGGGYATVRAMEGAFSMGDDGHMVARTRMGMGTVVSLTVVDPSEDRAEDAMARAFAAMDRLEALLTRFDSGAPLGELRRVGKLDDAPAELVETVAFSARMHRATAGAFDVTVAPLLELTQSSLAAGAPPSRAAVAECLTRVGMDKLNAAGRSLSFARPGMAVTLDGVAKGRIVDAMAAELAACGIRHALVNAGGDIRALGGRGAGRPWTVAVRAPRPEGRREELGEPKTVASYELTDGACATSGDYEIFFDSERIYHHIVNPATGLSPHAVASSTVLAADAGTADALATALLVTGPAGTARVAPLVRGTLLLGPDGQACKA
jgi:thiamine biosynthesis lipoprotein